MIEIVNPYNERQEAAPRCPICGSDKCCVIYTQGGLPIGCDWCIDGKAPCTRCGSESYDNLFYNREGDICGCTDCTREIPRWQFNDG